MNGIIKWLKDKRDNILIPNTLTTAVFNSDGKNVDELLDGKLDTSLKGVANGVAELDDNGKVLPSQLPSYVDDVEEYESKSSFPITGEGAKIYIDTTTNLSYRWTGSTYVEIGASVALGETSSTAYRGDRGKVAYEHSQETSGNPHGVTASDVNAVAIGGNTATNTVTFTSNDVADGSATSWTSVSALASGITHATFFQRASQMFKNVRYLYKMLGTTDISSVGNGTVTGAISTLNSNLGETFQNRGWIPNGATLSSLSAGAYGTSPDRLPSVGVPDGYSQYGTFIVADGEYTSFIYNDVYGNLASYNTNQNNWTKYYSAQTVESVIASNRVKQVTIEYAAVTSNPIGSNSPFYGTGYTYYVATNGISKTTIDNLISQGHTVLGGFISRGACNDGEGANNIVALTGMVVNYNTYCNCPYQIVFVSNGYQTMHCYVTILYI